MMQNTEQNTKTSLGNYLNWLTFPTVLNFGHFHGRQLPTGLHKWGGAHQTFLNTQFT